MILRRSLNRILTSTFTLILLSYGVAHANVCSISNTSLIAHYPMDSYSGSATEDAVNNLSAIAENVRTVGGQVGNAYHFDSSSIVAPGYNDIPVSSGITISMWIKPDSLESVESRFISKAYGLQNNEHFIMAGSFAGSALRFRLKIDGTTRTLISRPGKLRPNRWSFVTFTYNDRAMRIFHNAKVVAHMRVSGTLSRDASVPTAIGNQPQGAGSRPFLGTIDDVRIYNSALSPRKIEQLMSIRQSGCAGSTTEDSPIAIDPPVVEAPAAVEPPSILPTADGWPANANEDLPMAGIFYGQQEAGLVTGNATIGYESSRRFRAEKSGFISAVRYNNRTLQEANIGSRCKPSAPNSVWCKCKNAGLDRYTCGYTLGNSYSVGNGGSIVIEVRPNNESDQNRPGSTILGRTAGRFVPLQRANEHYPILELEEPVWLQAGEIYHLVYTNKNPPLRCKLNSLSVSEAASCPRNQGAIGLNGTFQPVQFGASKKYGPFGGDAAGNLVKTSRNGSWKNVDRNLSWYEVGYVDGTWIGDSHTGYGSTGNGRKFIGGGTVGRQIFTVRDATRSVDGLWVYYGHSYDSTPDGSPMKISVKDSRNRVLATGSIKSSRECASTAASGLRSGNFREQHCRVWEYTELSSPVSLLEGQTYTVEFSASATAGFSLHTFFPLNYGVWQSTSRNFWNEAHAEVSTNGGSTWKKWAGDYYPDRDINMLFTVQGMPKQLP